MQRLQWDVQHGLRSIFHSRSAFINGQAENAVTPPCPTFIWRHSNSTFRVSQKTKSGKRASCLGASAHEPTSDDDPLWTFRAAAPFRWAGVVFAVGCSRKACEWPGRHLRRWIARQGCMMAPGLLSSAVVNPATLIEQMENYLSLLGVEVCSKPFQVTSVSAGGLVKLNGRTLVVVDSKAPQVERLMVLADALCGLDCEPTLLPPEVQRIVAKAKAKRRWRRKRLIGRANVPKPLWLQSRLLSKSPGLRACRRNGPQS